LFTSRKDGQLARVGTVGPIYQQIADKIKDEIVLGVLRPDQQVMSTNECAAIYGVDPGTVARGYRHLVDEGLLYRRTGVGMFVSPEGWARLRGLRQKRFFAEVFDPTVAEAVALGISLDEIVARVRRLKGGDSPA
jgi:DNA-binding transcriptional regulator YhcF (GntR family)